MSFESNIYIPINKYSTRALLRLFDTCYKTGVKDAIDIGNEMQCLEFCEKMYATEKFGRIIYDYEYTWKEWKYRLSQMLFDDIANFRTCTKYLECITHYGSYIACALPIAMDFYMKGIKDYCQYPNSCNLVRFNEEHNLLWGKTIKRVSYNDVIRTLTGFCFDRARLDEESIEYKREVLDEIKVRGRKPNGVNHLPIGLTRTSYENFQKEIWKYGRVRELKRKSQRW